MDVEITKMDGDSFRLSEYGVTVQDFNVSSVPVTGIYGTVEGRSGTVDYGADFGQRPISVPFYIHGYDMLDYPLLRDELFGLITTRDPFYIRELRRPTEFGVPSKHGDDDVHVGGKRYLVRIAGNFDLEQQRMYGFGEMSFETVGLPFAESMGTTQDLDRNGIRYSDELWSYGMGLSYDEEAYKYTFTSRSFDIINAGNVTVCPFNMALKITVTGAQGSVTIRNITTGDEFKYNENLNGGTLRIDGANITVNSLQALRDTNRRYITLAPGINRFNVSGGAEVAFDFRFYYK